MTRNHILDTNPKIKIIKNIWFLTSVKSIWSFEIVNRSMIDSNAITIQNKSFKNIIYYLFGLNYIYIASYILCSWLIFTLIE